LRSKPLERKASGKDVVGFIRSVHGGMEKGAEERFNGGQRPLSPAFIIMLLVAPVK